MESNKQGQKPKFYQKYDKYGYLNPTYSKMVKAADLIIITAIILTIAVVMIAIISGKL